MTYLMAAGEGFEPPVVKDYNGFQNRPIQPDFGIPPYKLKAYL